MDKIYFYSTQSEYGCFSNFSRHSFHLEGRKWATSEHYFQAQKFINSADHMEKVFQAKTPREAAKLGRDRSSPLREDWEQVKDDVMKRALYAKFKQNKDILVILLSTGNKYLIEETTDDYYWGCGTEKMGLNRLGTLLMEVRELLRKEYDIPV